MQCIAYCISPESFQQRGNSLLHISCSIGIELGAASDGGRVIASHWAVEQPLANKMPRTVNFTGCEGSMEKIDKHYVKNPPGNRKKVPAIKLDTWSVRIMTSGISDDLQEISDACKTADGQHCSPRDRDLNERDFYFWQGKSTAETKEHGVGFALRGILLGSIIPPTERILSLLACCKVGL